MGRMIVYGMEMLDPPPDSEHHELPFLQRDTGVFISAHTSIDDATGTVEEHKLFHREMVAPGATFLLRLRLLPAGTEVDETDILEKLGSLLGAFANKNGVGMGRGRQDANGRLRADEKPELTVRALDENGDLKEVKRPELTKALLEGFDNPVSAEETLWHLTLTPDAFSGPFLIADATAPKRKQDEEGKNTIHALKHNAERPHLPGASFMGALRARAEWLAALKELRGEITEDQRQAIIETLFGKAAEAGDTGQRGRLGLRRLEVTAEGTASFPSVALNRFSMAPMGSALFVTEGFIGVKIEATLALDANIDAPVENFMTDLITDLEQNGLTLGHGESRGFGWFTIKTKESSNA